MHHSNTGITVLGVLAALFFVWTMLRVNRRERQRKEREQWVNRNMGVTRHWWRG